MLSATCFTSYFTVGVLTGINLLNYMDRYTLAGRSPYNFLLVMPVDRQIGRSHDHKL